MCSDASNIGSMRQESLSKESRDSGLEEIFHVEFWYRQNYLYYHWGLVNHESNLII